VSSPRKSTWREEDPLLLLPPLAAEAAAGAATPSGSSPPLEEEPTEAKLGAGAGGPAAPPAIAAAAAPSSDAVDWPPRLLGEGDFSPFLLLPEEEASQPSKLLLRRAVSVDAGAPAGVAGASCSVAPMQDH
jgi:hypothetical protein